MEGGESKVDVAIVRAGGAVGSLESSVQRIVNRIHLDYKHQTASVERVRSGVEL